MLKRIVAILFIFGCTGVAWAILGGTIFSRTYSSDDSLRGRVEANWGSPHVQKPPTATYARTVTREVDTNENGRPGRRTVQEQETRPLPLERSRVAADLKLEHRQKGLLWYATYQVAFTGSYAFLNTGPSDTVTFTLPFPTAEAIYDDLVFTVDGRAVPTTTSATGTSATVLLAPGRTATLGVGYRSRGLSEWRYSLANDGVSQVRDFELKVTTDFRDVDFGPQMLSPGEKTETAAGWDLRWRYRNLVTGYDLGVVAPEKLQPGPLAGRISFFAPVSLFFFFFILFIVTAIRNVEVHPMNYFFLAAAFFSFHLLLAYLADQVSIHAAFAIASLVSVLLVATYLRLVTGWRFALTVAAPAQLIYLVLFSYAFFFKGFTGLAVTIGSILTLFVVMQMTGRIRWAEKFETRPSPPRPAA
jgi:inner membrane protein involved in colicin E2 resistance